MFRKHTHDPQISSVKNHSSPLHNIKRASESQTDHRFVTMLLLNGIHSSSQTIRESSSHVSSPLRNIQRASESQTDHRFVTILLFNAMDFHRSSKQCIQNTIQMSSPPCNIQRASESQQAPGERPQLFSKGLWRQIDMSRIGDCLCNQLDISVCSFQTWDCYNSKPRASQAVTTPNL